MALPDDYLTYPWRRHGMDHDRYDWSMLPRRKKAEWPGGARIALWIAPALEWFPMDAKGKPFKPPGAMQTAYPDYRHYTHRDYGNRVGIFRIMQVLDEFSVRASVPTNAAVATRYPSLVRECVARNWEIIAHGRDMDTMHTSQMPVDEERAIIKESIATLRRVSGQAVQGWLSPAKSESANTLDLVAAEGIAYVCDWINDDMPFALRTQAGAIHNLPHAWLIDDATIILQHRHADHEFAEQVTDQFDCLWREAGRHGGRIMAITLHPWITGYPYRIKYLRAALAHILRHRGVWPATGAEILAAWKAQQ